jgi:integrase
MMTELKKWKLACIPSEFDLVFPNEVGGQINHNNMCYCHFEPAFEKAGIGKVGFHDLRHTYASLLIE